MARFAFCGPCVLRSSESPRKLAVRSTHLVDHISHFALKFCSRLSVVQPRWQVSIASTLVSMVPKAHSTISTIFSANTTLLQIARADLAEPRRVNTASLPKKKLLLLRQSALAVRKRQRRTSHHRLQRKKAMLS